MTHDDGETAVLDRLVRWAGEQPHIRAMLLESSRANPEAAIDPFSDYDVLLVVSALEPFLADEQWLYDFGPPLVRFNDSGTEHGIATYNRLVLYEDGTKVDYILWPVSLLRRVRNEQRLPALLDTGYRVLVDKDNLTQGLPPPTHTAYIPRRPTEQEYHALIEEFWWESTYVAKNIWRGELIQEKYNLDYVMKFELLRALLEWRIEIDHNWSVRPAGAAGKGLHKLLDRETWSDLASTYVGAGTEENWQALWKTGDLFRRIAIEVGDALGYPYPHDLDRRVMDYLQKVRSAEG